MKRPYEAPKMAETDSPGHDAMVKSLGWYVGRIEFRSDGGWHVETTTPGLLWSYGYPWPVRSWSDPPPLNPPAAPPS